MMRKRALPRILLICLLMIALLILSGCGNAAQLQETQYKATFLDLFDTVSQVIGYAADKDSYTVFSGQVKAGLAAYHALYDIY
ncbi:MAG: hypothetical protein ABIK64_01305, partial [Bacillota bacterium]